MKLFTRAFIKDLIYIALFCGLFYILTHNSITHPKLPSSDGTWSIQLVQQPIILGIAGHNYLVLRDNNNSIKKELHGLATDPVTGDWKTLGRQKTDRLLVHEFDQTRFYSRQKKFPGVILFTGTEEVTKNIWGKSRPCKDSINALNLPYPPYGVAIGKETENSNSVAYTLAKCMGLLPQHIGLITPGWGKNLLENQTTGQ